MSESQFNKVVLAGLGAAGVAAVLYCLLKEEPQKKKLLAAESKDALSTGGKSKVEDISKETVQKILREIIESQELMKGCMTELSKELRAKAMTFDETYDRVRKVQPSDPLEKHQLTMNEFDQLLDKYQSDPMVREAIAKIMGTPNASSVASEKVQGIAVKKIVEIHSFMLKELTDLVERYQSMPKNSELDMKTVTIVAQAIVGSKMEAAFGFSSEDIESAVLMHHTTLATNQEFAGINMKIQEVMGKLVG